MRAPLVYLGVPVLCAAAWVVVRGEQTPESETAPPPRQPEKAVAAAPKAPTKPDTLPYTDDDKMLLSAQKRKLVWEEEDRYFQLNKKALAPWDDALKKGDPKAIALPLAPTFKGRMAQA